MNSIEESNIIEFYRGVFYTYAELNNSIAQNISYSFDLEQIEPNNKEGITAILQEAFEYNGSNIITDKIEGSEFKKIISSWFHHSEKVFNLTEPKKEELKQNLYENIVEDLKITEFLKISESSFERNNGINQIGQHVELIIIKNSSTSYLAIFMLDG